MPIDSFTVMLATAIVVLTAGIVYILETIQQRDTGAGRVWAIAFLAGMLTVTSYLLWAQLAEPWVAVAVGNASLVVSAGCFWLGCRSYNGRSLRATGLIVVGVAAIALVAVLVGGPTGGDWAGAFVMFVGIAAFAAIGTVESRRGTMRTTMSSLGFTIVLGVQTLFYIGRAVTLAVEGPEGALFTTWFGSSITGFLTMILTIVAAMTATVLRTDQFVAGRAGDPTVLAIDRDGVLGQSSFDVYVGGILGRAQASSDLVGVIALRIDDLPRVGTAFGSADEAALTAAWRNGVRRYAPSFAVVGEHGPTMLLVGFQPSSVGDARRIASRIHRRLLDDFAGLRSAIIPVVGIGVALSDTTGYDVSALVERASEAALRSASSSDASIMIAGAN